MTKTIFDMLDHGLLQRDAAEGSGFYADGYQFAALRANTRVAFGMGADSFDFRSSETTATRNTWLWSGDSGDEGIAATLPGARLSWFQAKAGVASIWDRGIALSGAASNRKGNAWGGAFLASLRYTDAGAGTSVWGGYAEATREPATLNFGSIRAFEMAAINFAGEPASLNERGGTPYNQGWSGQTLVLQLQSGGQNTMAYPADNPLVIARSLSGNFYRGVIFEVGAIIGVNGGLPEAILLPEGNCLTWYAETGEARVLDIYSAISAANSAAQLVFEDAGLTYRKMNGATLFHVENPDSPTAYPFLMPGTGQVSFTVDGDADDASLIASGKGSGLFGFGAFAADPAITPGGGVMIETTDGTRVELLARVA